MEERRAIRKQFLIAQAILRNPVGLNTETHVSVCHILDFLKGQLQSVQKSIDIDLITDRRKLLSTNTSLYDIFSIIWNLMSEYVSDGIITRDGYNLLHKKSQKALFGNYNSNIGEEFEEELRRFDWEYDIITFGPLDRLSFFDMMYEFIETWSVLVDPKHYAAFAWAYLDSIADTSKFPPKFRLNADIKCILTCMNMTQIVGKSSCTRWSISV